MLASLRQNARFLTGVVLFLILSMTVFTQLVVPWAQKPVGTGQSAGAMTADGESPIDNPHEALGEDLDERLGQSADGQDRVEDVTVDNDVLTVRYRIRDLPTEGMQRTSAIADAKQVLVATASSTISPDKIVVEAVLPDKPATSEPDLVAEFDGDVAPRIDEANTRVEQIEAAAQQIETTLGAAVDLRESAHVDQQHSRKKDRS